MTDEAMYDGMVSMPDLPKIPVIQHPVTPKLHPILRNPRYWACSVPEMPGTGFTNWSNACRACTIHLAVCMRSQPEARARPIDYTPTPGVTIKQVRLVDTLAREAEDRWDDEILRKLVAEYGGDAQAVRDLLPR